MFYQTESSVVNSKEIYSSLFSSVYSKQRSTLLSDLSLWYRSVATIRHIVLSFSMLGHSHEFCQIWQGHDVIAIASPDRYVVGLDISESAIEIATKVTADCFFNLGKLYISRKYVNLRAFWCKLKPDISNLLI